MKNEELCTTKDVCEKYKVTRQSVSKWVQQGLACHKLGYKMIRYDMNEVDSWLKKRGEKWK